MATKNRVSVKVKDNNIESAIRYFNKRVSSSQILYEYKNNQEYEKPSVLKRKKKKEAEYNQRLEDKRNLWSDLKMKGIQKK